MSTKQLARVTDKPFTTKSKKQLEERKRNIDVVWNRELKLCPFCRQSPKVRNAPSGIYMVYCDCGAVVSFKGAKDREQVVEMWNGRK